MPISSTSTESLSTGWSFRWVPSGMVYLGIKLMSNITKMMQANLQPIIQNIEYLLHNWSKLNISLLGRVNLIKMIIMPKVNYITYMLPLSLPAHLRKEYDKCEERVAWSLSYWNVCDRDKWVLVVHNPVLEFTRESWKRADRNVKNNPLLTSEASIWFNSKIRIAKNPFCTSGLKREFCIWGTYVRMVIWLALKIWSNITVW